MQETIGEDISLEDHAKSAHNLTPSALESIIALTGGAGANNGVAPPNKAAERTPNSKEAAIVEIESDCEGQQRGSAAQIGSISEKHVYKYRCNHCSLAFRTQVHGVTLQQESERFIGAEIHMILFSMYELHGH